MKKGAQRKIRRIQEALDKRHMTFSDVARSLGITPALVYRTAHGRANHRRVLRHLLALGVNPAYLDLPDDLLPAPQPQPQPQPSEPQKYEVA